MAETFFTVEILPDGTKVRARAGEVLADVLVRAGLPLSLYCRQRGVCGKCAVRILSGPLPFPEPNEAALLRDRGLGPDHRLACQYLVRGHVSVETLPGSRLEKIAVLDAGPPSAAYVDPAVKRLCLVLEKPPLRSPTAVADDLRARLKSPGLALALPALSKLGGAALGPARPIAAILYDDRELLDIEPDEAGRELYGLAVDLGTTTVALELVDLRTGQAADRVSAVNAQASYGADVVSRITFAFENPDNLRRLRTAAVQLVNDLIGTMCRRTGVPRHRIYDAVVAGNTAMNHIFCGVAVDTLALAPFQAVFSSLPPFPAADIGLALHPQARVYVSPNVKSFVGGDITAGLAASGLAAASGPALFIDLGTNGEIVVKKGGEFAATSTAAGPAFEGMNISCGMLAVPGAVDRAGWAGGFKLRTIDDLPPQGVCGTGLIDILAVALARGLLGRDGRIQGPEKRLRLTDRLSLTQQDVRDVQLAVGAVRSGVELMLREFRVKAADLDRVLVAGSFGSSLDLGNAVALGLLPDVPLDRIAFVGNSSLAGARLFLVSRPARAAAEALAARIGHVSLAVRPDFQEEFVRALEFDRYPKGDS
ncbi:MAG TPA: ASKHA domain-containing protein [Candidatus Aminicenantes bacterium]|nr:ASKHA domain-containing protein [Candidatus Aminicenantes bacterium]HRY65179.1 ASKHA domain-containing protein [Candidatus Aminicenantes bacterium]HRZ72353.1 ASKHA domain-containing protein [Candidatus Aminicenantes bacterium]